MFVSKQMFYVKDPEEHVIGRVQLLLNKNIVTTQFDCSYLTFYNLEFLDFL